MIPCCFHPTKVVVIDDNNEFLVTLSQNLCKEQASYQYFTNPLKALAYMNDVYRPNPFPNRYIKNVDEEDWEHRRLDVDIPNIHQEAYRAERFEEISTIIIDLSMPAMSGLHFAKMLKDSNIQKILLTGIADESIAIEAFNKGLIHHFIRKQDFDMVEQLNEAVEKAQWRYFTKLSEVPLKAIAAIDIVDHAVLDDKFTELFKNIMRNEHFTEAYLCETVGSYLLLNDAGEARELIVNNEEQIESWIETAEALNIEPALLQQLINREKMICYPNIIGHLEPSVEEWAKHAYPAQSIQGGTGTYYYTFAPDIFGIETTHITSFEKYKETISFSVNH